MQGAIAETASLPSPARLDLHTDKAVTPMSTCSGHP